MNKPLKMITAETRSAGTARSLQKLIRANLLYENGDSLLAIFAEKYICHSF